MTTVEYQDDFGPIRFPEGFEEKLAGKSIEKQAEFFRITESATLARTAYGELEKEQITEKTYRITNYSGCTGLIVKRGILVGVLIRDYFSGKPFPCLPYGSVCTYYASDNNGSGYNEREDWAYLILI